MARWDGEHVERLWAWLNAAAPSTKEMSPGARWETIDDFCGFANWRKTTQFGENIPDVSVLPLTPLSGDDLLCLLIEAVPLAVEHREDFVAFDRRLRRERLGDVSSWELMLQVWEKDHKKPNPYVLPKSCKLRSRVLSSAQHLALTLAVTRAEVQLKHLTAENKAAADGHPASQDLGPCSFIVLGLETRQSQWAG